MKESLSFDCAAEFYDETRGGLHRGGNFARAIDAHLERNARVLEVGVGTGLVALPLTELGHDVIGVDIAPAMLAKAKARIGARVMVADATRLPLPYARFDAAVAVWVLHVVGDREAALTEMHRVLRPAATLVVVPADAEVGADDITDARDDLNLRLGRTRDPPEVVIAFATEIGFSLEWRGYTDRFDFDESPLQQVARIEAREWSSLWNVEEQVWADVVQPVLDRLRALPEPERPRHRTLAHHLLVFRRP